MPIQFYISGGPFTGTGAVTVSKATCSGVGDRDAPDGVGVGFDEAPRAICSGVGTFTGPTYTGRAAIEVPQVRSISTAATGDNVSSLPLNAPSGVVAGDLLVICITCANPARTFSVPVGWTSVVNFLDPTLSLRTAMFRRIADGTSADTPTITFSGGTDVIARMLRIDGQHASPLLTFNFATQSSGATAAIPSISPTQLQALLVAVIGLDTAFINPDPVGWTQRVRDSLPTGILASLGIWTEAAPSLGSYGGQTATLASSNQANKLVAAFRPSLGTAIPFNRATSSGTGTFTPPVYTGSGAVVAHKATASGIGDVDPSTFTGTAALLKSKTTASGTGTRTVPLYTGVGAAVTAKTTAAGEGERTLPGIIELPLGRQGIGIIQPQSGIDYPLVSPSSDIAELLADLYLEYEDRSTYDPSQPEFVRPFRLAWVFGLGTNPVPPPGGIATPTHSADLIIVDAVDDIVFNSTEAVFDEDTNPFGYYDDKPWGDNYHIYEWRTATAACRVVAYTSWPPDREDDPPIFDTDIFPLQSNLDERTLYRMPKRVQSLRVVLDHLQRTAVDLVAGFNIDLVDDGARTDGQRRVHAFTINATPGAGQGIFPGCEEQDLVIRRINGVGPDAPGDFLLGAPDCYWIRQPTTLLSANPRVTIPSIQLQPLTAAHLQVGSDCGPCCPCEAYVDTVKYMNRVAADLRTLGALAQTVRDVHDENVQRWEDAKECREKHPLRLVLQAQNCPYLDVVAQFCNHTDDCQQNIELVIRFQTLPEIFPNCDCNDAVCGDTLAPLPAVDPEAEPPLVSVVCGRTFVSSRGTVRYTLQGQWCEYRAKIDAVEPRSSAFVKFRLKFPNQGLGDVAGTPTNFVVTGCLLGTIDGRYMCAPLDGGPEVARDVKTVTLECGEVTGGC